MEPNDLKSIAQNLQKVFPEFEDAFSVKMLGEGFGSLVIEGNNGIVFRIAKNQNTQELRNRETRLLPLLNNFITGFELPLPQFNLESSKDFPFGLVGYKKIEGFILQPSYLTNEVIYPMASQLATFLYQLHTIPITKEINEQNLPLFPPSQERLNELWDNISPFLNSHLNKDEQKSVKEWYFHFFRKYPFAVNKPVIVHGDLWYENIVVNQAKEIVGIIDFENISIGDVAIDFATQLYLPSAFSKTLIDCYIELGGETGDHLKERMDYLLGLRELVGLEYDIKTGKIDKDILGKIRKVIIDKNIDF